MTVEKVYLLDENTIDFESTEEVGLSIITLVEATKGKNKHDRHALFKKFLMCWNKSNYHIYLPAELNGLKDKLNKTVVEGSVEKQYLILEEMCFQVFSLVCSYFTQLICLIAISLIHLNHNFKVVGDEIPINSVQEKKAAECCNAIVKVYREIDMNKEKSFEDSYLLWKKGDGDSFGNSFFNLLMDKYYGLIGKTKSIDFVLCGYGKNITDVLNGRKVSISEEDIFSIFDAYFHFKINDGLTKRLFIPYIYKAINDERSKFEFNHVADSFLIFNALTAGKTENVSIELKSKDATLVEIYNKLKQ